jgi:hypothetical protein
MTTTVRAWLEIAVAVAGRLGARVGRVGGRAAVVRLRSPGEEVLPRLVPRDDGGSAVRIRMYGGRRPSLE